MTPGVTAHLQSTHTVAIDMMQPSPCDETVNCMPRACSVRARERELAGMSPGEREAAETGSKWNRTRSLVSKKEDPGAAASLANFFRQVRRTDECGSGGGWLRPPAARSLSHTPTSENFAM